MDEEQGVVGLVVDHPDLGDVDARLDQHLGQHDRQHDMVGEGLTLELREPGYPSRVQQGVVGRVPVGGDADEVDPSASWTMASAALPSPVIWAASAETRA